jgi:uncharacterized protein YrrD
VIEPGWTVVGRDGGEIGRVVEIVGDTGEDIFNGLAVASGLLGRTKYVPAERVAEIVEGEIRLDVPSDRINQLKDHGPQPPSAKFRA